MKQQQLLDLIEHTAFACGVEGMHICADGTAHMSTKRATHMLNEEATRILAKAAERIPTDGAAHMHTYRSDKEVIMYGYFKTPPTESFGIDNLKVLYALLTNPSLSLVKEDKNLLTFENTNTGNSVDYSFLSKKRMNDLLPQLELNSKINFDAIASLPDDFVEKLKQQAKIIGDDNYGFFRVESHINFRMGEWCATVQGNILLPADYQHESHYRWDIDLLIKILSQSGDYKLGVSSAGVMAIECKTEFARYVYLLPALMK